MKILVVLSFLVVFAMAGFAQPDSGAFYASSRLDYYTSEKVGEVLVFVPKSLIGKRVTIDLVFEYEILNRGVEVVPGHVSSVLFPMEMLRPGQNELTVSFNENDKWIDSRKIWITVRPHRDNEVKIDLVSGGLIVSGLPYMPFGFNTSFPVDDGMVDVEALKGFNLVSPKQQINKKTLKARRSYLHRFADIGIRVNYNLTSLLAWDENGKLNSGWKELLRKEIELFHDNPALLTWYIAENPDAMDIHPDSLTEVYRFIKELDPYHPVSLLISSPRNAEKYTDGMDIIISAPSPVPQGNILEVRDYTRIPNHAFWLQKPVWTNAQTLGGYQWWKREPTPGEVRAMTYLALIYGSRGIQYTKLGLHAPKSTAMWDECAAMALEFSELTPDILSPHPAPELVNENPGLHARAWVRSGLVTVIVVNEKNEPLPFNLKMVDVDLTISADVMFENRKINIRDGIIEDMIDGYGSRVYRFDARRQPDWVKGAERGNLTSDGGFEDISNAGVPSACYAPAGNYDAASTFFTDSRRFYEGEHSLRLNNPANKAGNRLLFYGLELSVRKSYTVSIMARTGASSNSPGGKRENMVIFDLGLGATEKIFSCTDDWQKYEINGIRITGQERISPLLGMAGKGTAWFDLLQVYPDMGLVELKGDAGNGNTIVVTTIHEDAQMYYTLDGSEPTTESQPYMMQVEIENGAKFKAAAFRGGVQVGYIEK